MPSQTRRAFLQYTPLGAAAVSLVPAMPLPAAARSSPEAPPRSASAARGSMVIHVSDVRAGKMTLFVGEREVALQNPRLVAYFVESARSL